MTLILAPSTSSQQLAGARLEFGSGLGMCVQVHRAWTNASPATIKRPSRHLRDVST